ncbi:HET-domain-containing protein, partial [Dichomitus squalens LYAD-421 SS1]
MRLLNTRTGRFHWFEDPRHVRYAILSHVWSKDKHNPEKTYQDVLRFESEVPEGEPILSKLSSKLRRFCEVSHENGFEFGWADSCCIDKTSSSELSEAITSMYDWYRYAAVCYAFLHDVRKDPEFWRGDFCNSEWFTRGWTLQELLAPTILLFFSQSWDVLGSKQTLAILIQEVTTIDHAVLTFERSLEEVSIARKMSWAASRRTSREEDEAYSLMGIFGVSIPITYGEGRYAYVRLQEEIIRVVPDQSIFGWGPPPSIELPPTTRQYLLASCPKDFEESSALIH